MIELVKFYVRHPTAPPLEVQIPNAPPLRELPGLALLQLTLSTAVPLWVERLRGVPDDDRLARARRSAQVVAEKGDVILFRSKRSGETARAFNALAEGVACAVSFGERVRLFALVFEPPDGHAKADPHPPEYLRGRV